MRTLVGLLAVVTLAGSMASCSKQGEPEVTAKKTTLSQPQTVAAREPSQHNWPKHALNRATDVKRQVAEQRKGEAAVTAAEADQP